MMQFMEVNGLFHPSHHGYKSGQSTFTALIELYDSWVEALKSGELSRVMLVDLSAAFDCVVDHSLLLKKMKVMEFDNHCVKWCLNYLTNRYQSFHIDGAQSEFLKIEVGVPQWSILGPLFYILYTNDLPEVVDLEECEMNQLGLKKFNTMCFQCGGLVAFAVDSTITLTDSDPNRLSIKLTEKYPSYFTANKLKVNDDKTQLVVMTSSKK